VSRGVVVAVGGVPHEAPPVLGASPPVSAARQANVNIVIGQQQGTLLADFS